MNPFLSIWKQPRATIQYLIVNKTIWQIALISFLGAWASALIASVNSSDMEGKDFVQPSVIMEIILSFLGGIASLFIGAAFIALFFWLIGKLFKGTGTFSDMYKGSMLTMVPYTIMLPIVLIWLISAPDSFYGTETSMSAFSMIISIIFFIAAFVLSIFVLIVTIVMISEVHQFSKWRAFATMMIPTIAIIVIVLVLVVTFLAMMF